MRRRRRVRFKNSNLAAFVFSSPCPPPSPMDHEAVFCGKTSFSDPPDANNARRGVVVAFERAPLLLLLSKLISSDLGLPGAGGCNETEVAGV